VSPVRLTNLLLVLFTLALFSQVRQFEFINFDDPAYITQNPIVQQGLTSEGLSWAFKKLHGDDTYWHPVTWISHMLDCQLFGPDAGAHHIVNLLFHVANVLLLFHLLRRTTGSLWRAAIVAALFACHPLQVDTVAWVTERKNVLSGMFWFLTMLAYVRYAESPTRARYAVVLLCFALGLMSKPVLVALPCVLLLMDFWPLGRVEWKRDRKDKATSLRIPWKRAVLEKIPLLALSIISGIVTLAGHARLGTTLSDEQFPLSARLANAIVSYARYLQKTVWPTDLSVYYPLQTWAGWQVLLSLAVVCAITLLAVVWRARRPYFMVGWFWFLGVLVPTIGLVQASTQAMADRFAYLPLVGIFIAGVWLAGDFLEKSPRRRALAGVCTGLVLLAAAAMTWRQLGFWRNSITLFTHSLAVTRSNAVAHNNLGSALESARRPQEAEKHYREAIRIKPFSPQAHNNLGNVLDDMGRSEEALAAYHEALRLRPNVALVHNNLGVVLAKLGRLDEAHTNFSLAMKLQPREAHTYYLMGTLHLRRGDPRAAVNAFEIALQLNPNHLRTLSFLARLLAANDDVSLRNGARAVQLAERAVALTDQSQPAALDSLAIAYAEAGRFDEAVRAEETAVSMLQASNDHPALLNEILQRRELFSGRKPHREGATNLVLQSLQR
jgi:tetratricopeptide (TPR) repeat protein